jgi:hypothetical protein
VRQRNDGGPPAACRGARANAPVEIPADIFERVRTLCLALPEVTVRVGPDEREELLSIGHPFFASRAGLDRIGVLLTGDTDWEEIRELVTDSYRRLAPKKLAALLDEQRGH